MSGLRSDYIDVLARTCLVNFNCVTPCDLLKKISKGQSYICNLDPSYKEGSHYIALSIQGGTVIYFDSYGLPCMNEHIIDAFLKNNLNQYVYSRKKIQNNISLFCGYFCLAFLICEEKGSSLSDFVSFFTEDDLVQNEMIALNIIKNHIKNKNT